jgi:MSHA biogenesis protein MshJ
MNAQLQQTMDRFIRNVEKRSQAEKLLVLFVLIVGIVMGYLTYVSDPLNASLEAAERDIETATRQIRSQQTSYTQKVALSQDDPNRFANERLAVIRTEQEQLDAEINRLARELVTPANMTSILTAALQQQSGLELIQIQNTGAVPLRTGISSQSRAPSSVAGESPASEVVRNITGQVYQHGITLSFRGDFFSTLRYLRLLEDLSDSFYWDSVSFTQGQWPMATVRLQLHTLSTEEGFLGV